MIFEVVKTSKLSERNISLTFICTQIVPSPLPGTEGAAKKGRGLINIYGFDCCSPLRHLYRAARMLNQLRRSHRAWPKF